MYCPNLDTRKINLAAIGPEIIVWSTDEDRGVSVLFSVSRGPWLGGFEGPSAAELIPVDVVAWVLGCHVGGGTTG